MSTNTPPKSIRARMGTAMRRTSSVLSLGNSRPTTPGVTSSTPKPSQIPTRARSSSVATSASDTSSAGLPSIDTTSTPAVSGPPSLKPSPIAESPAREAAAAEADEREPVKPTPLAQVITASTESLQPERSGAAILESGSGPNIFTEEPDEMSLRGSDLNPVVQKPDASTESLARDTDTAPSYFELPPNPPAEPHSDSASASFQHAIIENTMGAPVNDKDRTVSDQTTPRPHGPADTENANVFYAFSEMPKPTAPDASQPPIDPIPNPATEDVDNGQINSAPLAKLRPQEHEQEVTEVPTPKVAGSSDNGPQEPEEETVEASIPITAGPPPDEPTMSQPKEEDVDIVRMPIPETVDSRPDRSLPETAPRVEINTTLPEIVPYDVGASQEAWASQSDNKDGLGRQLADGSVQTLQDPFADPVPSIHVSTISALAPSIMLHPSMPAAQRQELSAPQNTSKVTLERQIDRSISEIPSLEHHFHHETDERQPLLLGTQSPQTSYVHPSSTHPVSAHLNVSGLPSSTSSVAWPQIKASSSHSSTPRLNHLGWIEYALPDTTVYYSHPTLRVTTDVDLRSITKLEAVTAYLEHRRLHDGSGTPPGFELWLRQGTSVPTDGKSSTKKKRGLGKTKEFVAVRYWVDHKKRMVTSDPIWDAQGDGSGRRHPAGKVIDDSLDMEYRYWAFMEDHPAHISLPLDTRTHAMDVLTWSWTDRLLPSQRDTAPPFTQAECQELNNLLRSFGDASGDSAIQTVLQTRVVARIFMRVVQWRQANFRPHKPLPQDVGIRTSALKKQSSSTFQRTFLDIMVAVIFLGVPCLFTPRINSSSLLHLDQESGLFNSRSAGPMLLLGGCTCLVAAIVLSASVTFLSLPGLDGPSRIPGLVAVLLATFSMVSSLVALFRYKSDMECISSNITWLGDRVSGEGLMLHSKRVVVLSFPLALLAYSIISFVVGIVLYSFFGVSETPVNVLQKHFEDYTRWTVVGVLGGMTGILFTSLLLLRR